MNIFYHFLDSPVDFNKNWRSHRDRRDDQSKEKEEERRERRKEKQGCRGFQRLLI